MRKRFAIADQSLLNNEVVKYAWIQNYNIKAKFVIMFINDLGHELSQLSHTRFKLQGPGKWREKKIS